ncbi:MAG TPA: ornithine carbamoyltransferase [Ktedonobacterales bacterium]|nr:ornithine carbamoyltransferase [Ktedonobacterales bacterium]
MRHILTLDEITPTELAYLCALTQQLKQARTTLNHPTPLVGRTVALLFEKPSLRTRVSFEVAARELGATSLYLSPQEVGLGKREAVKDVAQVLSAYAHVIVLRTFSHALIEEFARHSQAPVINGLTDTHHPCQGLTDLFTIAEALGTPAGRTLAYVGDGNNVAHSLLQAAAKAGMHVRLATPHGYAPDPKIVAQAQCEASATGGSVSVLTNPQAAAHGADVIYTDVWASMGQESEAEKRRTVFAPYQVNGKLVALAAPHVIVMHPLPAHRGDEITDEVMDGPHARVFVQAENRLHMQKAILRFLLASESTASATHMPARQLVLLGA